MSEELEFVHGSGNLFRDFHDPNADVLQMKALLAAEIIGILDEQKLSTRKAAKLTGIDQSEFVRIRKPDLKRFTIDRLITILNKFDQKVEIDITVIPRFENA
ncbi:MAG: XRE family transcriptional regulator [Candidatus Omnitrophota bacterium]|jgi:predicted XRE-type DNA-binding protein|nr:MAG: XRE family transcriptional regulator [Candidatus Omnitrophota bacterium]